MFGDLKMSFSSYLRGSDDMITKNKQQILHMWLSGSYQDFWWSVFFIYLKSSFCFSDDLIAKTAQLKLTNMYLLKLYRPWIFSYMSLRLFINIASSTFRPAHEM